MWESGAPAAYGAFKNRNYGGQDGFSHKRKCSACLDLSQEKLKHLHTMSPDLSGNRTCTMLMLTNLAQPEWVSISCEDELLSHVLCHQKVSSSNSTSNHTNVHQANKPDCFTGHILVGQSCFSICWKNITDVSDICKASRFVGLKEARNKLAILIQAVQGKFPPFAVKSETSASKVLELTFDRHLTVLLVKTQPVFSKGHQTQNKSSQSIVIYFFVPQVGTSLTCICVMEQMIVHRIWQMKAVVPAETGMKAQPIVNQLDHHRTRLSVVPCGICHQRANVSSILFNIINLNQKKKSFSAKFQGRLTRDWLVICMWTANRMQRMRLNSKVC